MSNTNIINSTIADNLLSQCFNKNFFQIQGIYHRVCPVTNKIIAKKINMVCFNDLENMRIHSFLLEKPITKFAEYHVCGEYTLNYNDFSSQIHSMFSNQFDNQATISFNYDEIKSIIINLQKFSSNFLIKRVSQRQFLICRTLGYLSALADKYKNIEVTRVEFPYENTEQIFEEHYYLPDQKTLPVNFIQFKPIEKIKFETFINYETAYNNKEKMTEQEYELITAYIYMIHTNLRKHLEYIASPSIGIKIKYSVSI